ncbi:MAG: biopolymer transporter ExbD [bacterium]|nr:biopolymer transporter ExbD [bacterium]
MQIDAKPSRPIRIGLTPLVDVVFILLVFFMLATSFLDWSGIAIEAPVVVAERADEEAIVVRVREHGGFQLLGEEVARGELTEAIARLLAAGPERRVAVVPDPEAPLQQVVHALDDIAAAGGTNITLARSPGEAR